MRGHPCRPTAFHRRNERGEEARQACQARRLCALRGTGIISQSQRQRNTPHGNPSRALSMPIPRTPESHSRWRSSCSTARPSATAGRVRGKLVMLYPRAEAVRWRRRDGGEPLKCECARRARPHRLHAPSRWMERAGCWHQMKWKGSPGNPKAPKAETVSGMVALTAFPVGCHQNRGSANHAAPPHVLSQDQIVRELPEGSCAPRTLMDPKFGVAGPLFPN